MGIGRGVLNLYKDLNFRGFFKGMASVMELGAQELHGKTKEDYLTFLKAIGKENAEKLVSSALSSGKKGKTIRERLLDPHRIPARYFYEWLGFSNYKAIDKSGEFGALVFDLNENIQKHYKFTETFDLVTNHGTSEHLFNQAAFFENVHNLAKVGGYMLHVTPFQGYATHCFFNPQPPFYRDLAIANKYSFAGLWLCIDGENVIPYSDETYEKLPLKHPVDLNLICLLKKNNDEPFKHPFQSSYAAISQLKTEGNYSNIIENLKFSEVKKPLWKRVANRILDIRL